MFLALELIIPLVVILLSIWLFLAILKFWRDKCYDWHVLIDSWYPSHLEIKCGGCTWVKQLTCGIWAYTVVFFIYNKSLYFVQIIDNFKGFHSKNTKGHLRLSGKAVGFKEFGFFNLLLNPFYGQSLVEIGEMACATSAWSYRGLTLNPLDKKQCYWKPSTD